MLCVITHRKTPILQTFLAALCLLAFAGCGPSSGLDTVLDYQDPSAAQETSQHLAKLTIAEKVQYDDAKFFIMAYYVMNGEWGPAPDLAERSFEQMFNGKSLRAVIEQSEQLRAALQKINTP